MITITQNKRNAHYTVRYDWRCEYSVYYDTFKALFASLFCIGAPVVTDTADYTLWQWTI